MNQLKADKNHNRIEYICPLCNEEKFDLLRQTEAGFTAFNKNKAKFYICNNCGLVFRYPRPNIEELLGMFYAVEYWQAKDINCSQLFKTSYSKKAKLNVVLKSIGEKWTNKSIIDMGCGFGSLVATLATELPKCQIVGIEPSLKLAEYLQDCNLKKNVEIIRGSIEKMPNDLSADVVFLTTVFEHIFDPTMALEKLHNWLSSDGLLVIELPDVMEPGELGLDYFFRDFHLFYYSEHTLSSILGKNGFEVISVNRGGVFKTATAPTLCIIARKVKKGKFVLKADEAERIKNRINLVHRKTRITSSLLYIYRYKLRRPFLSMAGKVKRMVFIK
jgi:SAM-dependent methyltransferase